MTTEATTNETWRKSYLPCFESAFSRPLHPPLPDRETRQKMPSCMDYDLCALCYEKHVLGQGDEETLDEAALHDQTHRFLRVDYRQPAMSSLVHTDLGQSFLRVFTAYEPFSCLGFRPEDVPTGEALPMRAAASGGGDAGADSTSQFLASISAQPTAAPDGTPLETDSDELPGPPQLTREVSLEPTEEEPPYVWLTYGEIHDAFMSFGSGLLPIVEELVAANPELELPIESEDVPPRAAPRVFVAIMGSTRVEWLMTDVAMTVFGQTSVPIHTSLPDKQVLHVLRHTGCPIVVASRVQAHKVLRILSETAASSTTGPDADDDAALQKSKSKPLRVATVIQMECLDVEGEDRESAAWAAELGITLTDMHSVQQAGLAAPREPIPTHPTELSSIVFTSGSTGTPKGARITDVSMMKELYDMSRGWNLPVSLVLLEFHPFAWMTGRDDFRYSAVQGGAMALFNIDISHLFEHYQLVRPVRADAVPAIWAMLFAEYLRRLRTNLAIAGITEDDNTINQPVLPPRGASVNIPPPRGVPETLINDTRAFTHSLPGERLERYKSRRQVVNDTLEEFRKMNVLGDRVAALSTGGAKTPEAVMTFLKRCFNRCHFSESYGTTEAGGIARDGRVIAGVEIKLVSVPEMGYFTTDKPIPRGEVYVKTDTMVDGYWDADEVTAERFEGEWFRTGDVAEYDAKTGRIRLVDRRKHLFKLQHGEFVSPNSLEAAYTGSPAIDQCYVYGDINRNCLVAIAVMRKEVYAEVQEAHDGDAERHVLREFSRIAKAESIPMSQVPRAVTIVHEAFTADNGLLTPSLKPCRPRLEKRFQDDIERMYASVQRVNERSRIAELILGLLPHREEEIRAALAVGEDGVGTASTGGAGGSLSELGLSSVASMRLHGKVKRKFDLDIDPRRLNTMSISELLSLIESSAHAASMADDKPSAKPNQREFPAVASAGDLAVDEEDEEDVEEDDVDEDAIFNYDRDLFLRFVGEFSPDAQEPCEEHFPRTVLLTGATGFLGSHILARLLSMLPMHCLVHCTVRAPAGKSATFDLGAATDKLIDNLKARGLYESGMEFRVQGVPADLSKPLMGIDPEMYEKVRGYTDLIIHCGAVVNWMSPYSSLREANVLGSIEVLKLASVCGVRPDVHFISTAGVSRVPEEAPLDLDTADLQGGYNRSKGLAEDYFRRVCAQLSLPLSVYRPGMIGPHSTSGHCHTSDFVPRYLTSVAELEAYPDVPGGLEIVPVDVSAEIIASLCMRRFFGVPMAPLEVFHVVNPPGLEVGYATLGQYVAEALKARGDPRGDRVRALPFAEWAELCESKPSSLSALREFVRDHRFWRTGMAHAREHLDETWAALQAAQMARQDNPPPQQHVNSRVHPPDFASLPGRFEMDGETVAACVEFLCESGTIGDVVE